MFRAFVTMVDLISGRYWPDEVDVENAMGSLRNAKVRDLAVLVPAIHGAGPKPATAICLSDHPQDVGNSVGPTSHGAGSSPSSGCLRGVLLLP